MKVKAVKLGRLHTVLILFVAINIMGDIGNVAFWWANSSSRDASLNTGYIASVVGNGNALIAGTIILLVVSAVYAAALFGLLKKMAWAPLLVIAISVANRAIALPLYFISPAFAFWAVWTVILVAVSYLDWKKLKAQS
jgi:hypothetical protein